MIGFDPALTYFKDLETGTVFNKNTFGDAEFQGMVMKMNQHDGFKNQQNNLDRETKSPRQ